MGKFFWIELSSQILYNLIESDRRFSSSFFFLDFFLFLILERECTRRGRGKERDKRTPHWTQSPTWGSIPWPRGQDLSRNHESAAQPNKPHQASWEELFLSNLSFSFNFLKYADYDSFLKIHWSLTVIKKF